MEGLFSRYPSLLVCRSDIEKAYFYLRCSFQQKGKLLIAGNGGSAADSEHIVGELMKAFVKKRELSEADKEKIRAVDNSISDVLCHNLQQSLPAIALTCQSALNSAYANDVNPELCFAQQVYGYGKKEDIFWGITTSGNSQNIIYAMTVAKSKGMKTIALTGRNGGRIKEIADCAIIVPEQETYKIQELHLPIYHVICLMLESYFFGE